MGDDSRGCIHWDCLPYHPSLTWQAKEGRFCKTVKCGAIYGFKLVYCLHDSSRSLPHCSVLFLPQLKAPGASGEMNPSKEHGVEGSGSSPCFQLPSTLGHFSIFSLGLLFLALPVGGVMARMCEVWQFKQNLSGFTQACFWPQSGLSWVWCFSEMDPQPGLLLSCGPSFSCTGRQSLTAVAEKNACRMSTASQMPLPASDTCPTTHSSLAKWIHEWLQNTLSFGCVRNISHTMELNQSFSCICL